MSIVIFLDIDGVLHKSTDISGLNLQMLLVSGAQSLKDKGLFKFLPDLKNLVDEIELEFSDKVDFVFHSSWRAEPGVSLSLMRELMGEMGGKVMGFTSSELGRQASIEDFIDRAGVESYLVIDDAYHEFDHGFKNLIVTNPLKGVQDLGVQKKIFKCLTDSHKHQSSNISSYLTPSQS